jgi:hypothetical protein
VETLRAEDIAAIYGRFAPGRSLSEDFRQRFGQTLDEDALNQNHQIIIVAASLDDSTERIVAYLSDRDIPINVLCFQVFTHGTEQLLSRAWLLDPVRTQVSAATTPDGPNEPWNGEFYCSYGHSGARSWADAVDFGFICGGGGAWNSRTLQLLSPGDRVWVKVPGSGFVGVGHVIGRSQPASTFKVKRPDGEVPVLDAAKRGSYHREFVDDPVLITAHNIPISNLSSEGGGACELVIEQLTNLWGVLGNSGSVININFRLLKPLATGSFLIEHLDSENEENPFDW